MSVMESTDLIEISDLRVVYSVPRTRTGQSSGSLRAVDGITASVKKGESFGIVGETGAGKSTLGRALVRLETVSDGTLSFDGIDITHRAGRRLKDVRSDLQMAFQGAAGSLNPRRTVEWSIGEPLRVGGNRPDRSIVERRVVEVLGQVGLGASFRKRYPHQLSGGQRQRVALARALVTRPKLVVCDEPITGLDVAAQGQIINLMRRLKESYGLTYVIIGHDLAAIRLLCDRIAVMYAGKFVEVAPVDVLFRSPSHPYTFALRSTVPDSIRGTVESPQDPTLLKGDVGSVMSIGVQGCRFRSRCWLYEELDRPERCRLEEPMLVESTEGSEVACHYSL